ncbi:hypothetical protein EV177_005927 [Coemansia sp. RSA 1804]|nr:hypothetical protein EV177_005927 [Coemansia sp. RSA 1804]
MAQNASLAGFVAKGKRRRADTIEHGHTAGERHRVLGKRHRHVIQRQDGLQKHQAYDSATVLAGNDYLWQQSMMTCAALEPMLLDDCDELPHGKEVLPNGVGMLATPATSPPHGASDSDGHCSAGVCDSGDGDGDGDEDDEWDDDELDPTSEYYEINKLLGQLHRERTMRQRQRG